jgi:hypothetical protein
MRDLCRSRTQINRIPFKLACPFLPTMMWSCTAIPERLGDVDDRFRHLDIGLRRRRIATRMVMQDALETAYRIEKLTRPSPANGIRGRQ